MECLKNLIGISDTDCECTLDGLTEEQRAEMKISVSGLYLDRDLTGGINIADIKDLGACGSYFRMAKEAIKAAQNKFEADIELAIGNRYKTQKNNFRGDLGRLTFTQSLPKTKNFQFLEISPKVHTDAVMVLNRGRIIVNSADTVSVYILAKKGDGDPAVIHVATVETQAHRFTNFELPANANFPLQIGGEKMTYYVAWEGAAETLPLNNSVLCGCSGGEAHEAYVILKGGETEDLTELSASDNFAHGLSLDVEIKCSVSQLVCREFSNQNKIAVSSAWANLYKAGEILIEKVLNSAEISRITMMNREYLYGKRNHFRSEYEKHVAYLSYEINVRDGNCFICAADSNFFVGNVFG